MDDFWVFGYGSLMWNPGFAFEERQQARLHGYRRSLCISSSVYRGTEEKPGLVLGLERGGSCLGVAFRVQGKDQDSVMAYLRERELVTNVYKERVVAIAFADGRRGSAVTYVADPAHEQYIGGLAVAEAASIVATAWVDPARTRITFSIPCSIYRIWAFATLCWKASPPMSARSWFSRRRACPCLEVRRSA